MNDQTKNLRVSQLIESVREELTKARSHLADIADQYPDNTIRDAQGALTCAIVMLYKTREGALKTEIEKDEKARGRSLKFFSARNWIGCLPLLFCLWFQESG